MRVTLLAVSVLALAACQETGTSSSSNPFVPASQIVPIPAAAKLLITTNAYATRAQAGREVFALQSDGGGITRLTFCADAETPCDNATAVASFDRGKLAMTRAQVDSNRDLRVGPGDDNALVVQDVVRGVLAPVVPALNRVMDVDWSPVDNLLVYTGQAGTTPNEDIFSVSPNGQNNAGVIVTATSGDRAFRFDRSGQYGVFEHTEAGVTSAWGLTTGLSQLTSGGDGSQPLAGSHYALGDTASPDLSPDAAELVFRRLIALEPAGLGSWELAARNLTTGAERILTTGARWRGAPDWGPGGIVFTELDGTRLSLVILDAAGARAVPMTISSSQSIGSVRWLP